MADTIGNIVGTITGSLVSIAISIALFAFTVWAIWTIATSYRSTGAKILWIIACLIFPFLGPLCWAIFGYKKNSGNNIENRNIIDNGNKVETNTLNNHNNNISQL